MNSRLTVNAGMRYEIINPNTEIHDRVNAFVPGQQSTVVPGAPKGLLFPGDAGVGKGIAHSYYKGFGPRVGFAWDPLGRGKTSIRAAYGIFYDPFSNGSNVTAQAPISALPYAQFVQISGRVNFVAPYTGRTTPAPNTFTQPATAFTMDPKAKPSNVQDWDLGIRQELGSKFVLETRYVGTKGTHLPRNVEANPAVFGPRAAGGVASADAVCGKDHFLRRAMPTIVAVEPMFLPDVEANPQPSGYLNLIERARAEGKENWQIWNLFAFRPEMSIHMGRFTHAVMYEPGPIPPALRELIATYTSSLNDCEFCRRSHAAFVGVMVSFAALVPYTFSLYLAPLQAEFGWKREAISRAFAIAALTVAACSPTIGTLLDRIAPRKVILPCIVVFACGIASLPLLRGNIAQFYGTYLLVGIVGNGTAQLAYSRAVLTWFEERRGWRLQSC